MLACCFKQCAVLRRGKAQTLQYYIFESRWMRRHGPATERAVVALQLWALKQPALLSAMVRCAPP
jgi:hypothetical protein